jgi:hypothetical protein
LNWDRDPAEDPILSARLWLDTYEECLYRAQRARHYPEAKPGDFEQMLAWADDPDRDRNKQALDILRERIEQHPRPPYSPEVLLVEMSALLAIPTRERPGQHFIERMYSWLDRVESFLAIGATAAAESATPAGNGYVARPLDPDAYKPLTEIMATAYVCLYNMPVRDVVKVIESYAVNHVRWTRPLGDNGKPHPKRRNVHLGDWHEYVKRQTAPADPSPAAPLAANTDPQVAGTFSTAELDALDRSESNPTPAELAQRTAALRKAKGK